MWVARNILSAEVNLSGDQDEVRRELIRSEIESSRWIEISGGRQHLKRKLEVRVCLAHSGNSKEAWEPLYLGQCKKGSSELKS